MYTLLMRISCLEYDLVWLSSHSFLICFLGHNRNSIELAFIQVQGLDGEERYLGLKEKSILYNFYLIYLIYHFLPVSSEPAFLQIPTFSQQEKLPLHLPLLLSCALHSSRFCVLLLMAVPQRG